MISPTPYTHSLNYLIHGHGFSYHIFASDLKVCTLNSKPTYPTLCSSLLGYLMGTRTHYVQTEVLTFHLHWLLLPYLSKWHHHWLLLKTETWRLSLMLPSPPPPHSKWVNKLYSSSYYFINLFTSLDSLVPPYPPPWPPHLLNYLLVSPFPFLIHSNSDSTV